MRDRDDAKSGIGMAGQGGRTAAAARNERRRLGVLSFPSRSEDARAGLRRIDGVLRFWWHRQNLGGIGLQRRRLGTIGGLIGKCLAATVRGGRKENPVVMVACDGSVVMLICGIAGLGEDRHGLRR
ncbi:hypothetical protein M0R45_035594 [Rubus argutus]|uniref:Uncharacterized protein n=1 Tax=Rubus argutus TaxID=59490 RepID=A0AAW1VW47_RUBAR